MGNENLNDIIMAIDKVNKALESLNTIPTAELNKKHVEINAALEQQNQLLKTRGDYKKDSDETQIKSVERGLNSQKDLIKTTNFDQKQNIANIDESLKTIDKSKKLNTNFNSLQNEVMPSWFSGGRTNASGPGSVESRRTPGDKTTAMEFILAKNAKNVAGVVSEIVSYLGPIGKLVSKGIDITVKVAEAMLEISEEMVHTANRFADKLQDYAGATDEDLKSTIQALGLMGTKFYGTPTKANQISTEILDAGNILVRNVGLAFGTDRIAEFQKAYADISKTSLAFHQTDYVTMGEIQKTLEMSAQESAELSNMFIEMGGSVDQVSDFFVSLLNNSTKAGVAPKAVMKDMKEYFKASELFKMGNSLQDVTNIMTYAKRIKVDMAGMFKLMDKVSTPEEAIDLAAQLQALDTVFLGLDPIDLFGAALTDTDRFMSMIIDPIRENVNKYFDSATGQLNQVGANFSRGFLKIKGVEDIFKSTKELTEFFAKASKEKNISEALMESTQSRAALLGLKPEDQKNIIGVLAAQYQGDKGGNVLNGKITGLGGKSLGSLTGSDFQKLLSTDLKGGTPKEKIEAAAQGTVSIKDQVDVNERLVKSMSQSLTTIDGVRTYITSGNYKNELMGTGNAIMDLALKAIEDESYKKIMVFSNYLDWSTKEAYLFGDFVTKMANKNFNPVVAAMKPPLDLAVWFAGSENLTDEEQKKNLEDIKKVTGLTTETKKESYGGIIGSMVQIPKKSLGAFPKSYTPMNGAMLADLLSMFTTNRTGAGIIPSMGGANKIVVSGEIRNYINDKDAGTISGDKVMKILEKQLS